MTINVGRARKWALMSACAAMTLTGAATTTMSQEAEVEELVVTGSRIRQNPLEARTPVMNLSEADIDATGQVSIGEYLQRLPITGSAINRANNTSGNLGFPPDGGGIGAGATEVDLRNLTSRRVLVLVDGKRWISGSSASGVSGAVDLNSIPLGAIDRVEILQDGASPIYGSDAIAGVVNIITKSDFEGLTASAFAGAFDEGDGTSQEYEINIGASSERARAFLDLSYTKQGAVSAGDRAISEFPVAGAGRCLATCSSGTPQGRFVFTDPRTDETLSITLNDGVLNDGMSNIPAFDPNDPFGGDFHNFTTDDRFNFQPFNFLFTPNKRVNVFGKAEYDVTDDIMLRVVGVFNNRQSKNRAAPEPLFVGPEGSDNPFLANIVFDETNPFNPFGVTLGPNDIIFMGRRPIEAGPRLFSQNVDTWLVTGTLEGETQLRDMPLYWDVNVTWAQAQANQIKRGAFNARRLAEAVGPLAQCQAVPGCVPFNYFGGQGPEGEGSITQEMLDFVGFIQKDESQQELFDVTFNISGSGYELPAGPLGWAIGYEHREQDGFFQPDAVVARGETAGVPSSPTDGGFSVDEFYGEINVPIIGDTPGIQMFEVSAAARVSDYNLFGSSTVFKIGANWRVNDDLLFRGSWSEGFRAPNIGELFNTGSRFDSTLSDPCSNFTASPDPNIQANCATLGVDPSFVQTNAQIGITTGGNLELEPETSESFTVGVVYDPSWMAEIPGIERVLFEATYYNIDIDGAIGAPAAQDILDLCVSTLDSLACGQITRAGTGAIVTFENRLINLGGIETDGIDWSVTYETEEFDYGRFRIQWLSTYLLNYTELIPTASGIQVIEREGTEIGSPERGFIKFRSSARFDWFYNEWHANVSVRYLGSLIEACPGDLFDLGVAEQFCSDAPNALNKIPNAVYTDIQLNFTPDYFENKVTFTLGINNLFSEETPICRTCDLNSFDGTLHPIPGAFGYAKISIRM